MKLIRFGNKGQEKPGVLINGTRRDCSSHFTDWNRDFFDNDGLPELQKLVDLAATYKNNVVAAECELDKGR